MDLAIYYGATRYPDLYQQRLMAESLLPVCSPRYRQQYRPLSGGDPAALVWIHACESTDVQDQFAEWRPVVPAQRTGVTFLTAGITR
ncbi:LysR family transcriptional regulator [Klebsiella pneumoniae]|uniref:LysR family transcriptional regulator n=1 Tax=Klebsiella pneumoniae TaxID=573 RepID=A0A447RJ92_KLEPN|nr:LysR family transcriptional regulator [Klebsiella pneumoniae]